MRLDVKYNQVLNSNITLDLFGSIQRPMGKTPQTQTQVQVGD